MRFLDRGARAVLGFDCGVWRVRVEGGQSQGAQESQKGRLSRLTCGLIGVAGNSITAFGDGQHMAQRYIWPSEWSEIDVLHTRGDKGTDTTLEVRILGDCVRGIGSGDDQSQNRNEWCGPVAKAHCMTIGVPQRTRLAR